MKTKAGFDSVVKWLLLCGWFALFIGGASHYSGSWLIYTMFSIVFLAMLISGLYRQISYGYFFLTVMLWLGFWFKFTVHLLGNYPFGESVGSFVSTPAAWDEVLRVATIGGIGVIVARLLYGLAGRPSSIHQARNSAFQAPAWYQAKRKWIWACLMFACVGLAIINVSLGILQIGLVPSTILMWPLNAVISWLIGYGFTLGIATLLWWDIALGRNISLGVYSVLLESFTSTVSMFSRGAFIFHAIPPLLGVYKHKNIISGWTRKNTLIFSVVFVVLFAISNPLVNSLRNFYYSGVPLPLSLGGVPVGNNAGGKSVNPEGGKLASNVNGEVSTLAKFGVDRWVGTEGVMAVLAYPEKGVDLFVRGIMERREIGKDTLYIEISRPVYFGVVDKSKFQFSEIPGAMAFLYYSGQLWVVALGMVVFVLTLLGSEGLIFKFTSNPLLSALWGGMAANAVAQMGVAPRDLLMYFFEMSCGIAAICFIQSGFFSMALQKFGASVSVRNGV